MKGLSRFPGDNFSALALGLPKKPSCSAPHLGVQRFSFRMTAIWTQSHRLWVSRDTQGGIPSPSQEERWGSTDTCWPEPHSTSGSPLTPQTQKKRGLVEIHPAGSAMQRVAAVCICFYLQSLSEALAKWKQPLPFFSRICSGCMWHHPSHLGHYFFFPLKVITNLGTVSHWFYLDANFLSFVLRSGFPSLQLTLETLNLWLLR